MDNKDNNGLIEMFKDSTKETRKAIDTNVAKGINKVADLLRSSPLGIKVDTYIAERPHKLEKAVSEMEKKYEKIPEDKRIEPNSFIALQTINNLNYALDEEYLREMFENIIVADMNQDKKSMVQPGYIDIVKQLSKKDALFLKDLKKMDLIGELPLVRLKLTDKNDHSYNYLTNSIICIKDGNFIEIPLLVQENLLRLKIIDVNYNEWFNNKDNYENSFNKITETEAVKNFNYPDSKKIEYQKGKLEFTEFGKNFINICVG